MKISILLSVILLLINIAEPNPTENDPFSSIIILNLDRRPDRWEQTRNELILANVESFERLSAVDGLRRRDLCTEFSVSSGICHVDNFKGLGVTIFR